MRNLAIVIIILLSFVYTPSTSQSTFWKPVSIQNRELKGIRYITPDNYLMMHFDSERFRRTFMNSFSGKGSQLLEIPLPDGSFLNFSMIETPVFDNELARKYPGFSSFTGNNENGDVMKMSISPYGIHVMILSASYGHVFIDPLTLHDHNDTYQIYFKKDFKKKTGNFRCSVAPPSSDIILDDINFQKTTAMASRLPGDCQLRSYRLAISCTGEYAAFHGGTKEKVLAAYNTTMTRVNGVYEKDAGITMKLIADTDKLIFLNAATDPFTNGNGAVMLDQNQTTIDNIIGRNNYDIGHVFSTGGGGIAQLRAPCTGSKAMGVTGQSRPVGDPFDIDYVAHEMGHQFGANHTQNNSCQRVGRTAVEPGSASTIMGYAGICEPNIQNNSDPYFHNISISEITDFVVAGVGNSCAQILETSNSKPQVSVEKNDYTIPRSTAFALTAIAQDSDNDNLTYCWEQVDNEVATMPPSASSTQGPLFRSINPISSPTRYFPDLLRKYGQWEVLPSVARALDFRCTVRDNHPLLGCTDDVEVRVNVTGASGPFIVTNPNTSSVSWSVGSTQTVTWDVAKTNEAPVNCEFVDIYLSIDGGATYPTLLAANVPNDGTRNITVPSTPTTKARVMVKSIGNIFYDISNVNFRIVASFNLAFDAPNITLCNEPSVTNRLMLTRVQTSAEPINLSINNPLPVLTYSLSSNTVVQLPEDVELIVDGLQQLTKGWHEIGIDAQRGSENLTTSFNLLMGYLGSNTVKTILPENNKFDVPFSNVYFEWENIPGVKDYTFEISLSPSFNEIINTVTLVDINYNLGLESGKVYFWRVKPNSPCTSLSYSLVSSFRTTGAVVGVANLLINEVLLVDKSSFANIDTSSLLVAGQNNDFITFTVVQLPKNGTLFLENVPMSIGNIFTQTDLALNKIRYEHHGNTSASDDFIFNIIDDQGRWLPNITFLIVIKQGDLGVVGFRDRLNTCFGDANAVIRCEGFGGVLPYSYSLDGIIFQTSPIFEGLKSGTYNLFIKDGTGKVSVSADLMIPEPVQLVASLIMENYDIKVIASGGAGNLNFSLDGNLFTSDSIIKDPGNGLINVYIRDESGCQIIEQIEIDIAPLKLDIVIVSDVKCSNQNAVLSVTGSGGIPPYTYSLDGIDYKVSSSFTVAPGKYSVKVRDAGNKIIDSDSVSTNNPLPIEVVLIQNKFQVTINATGGTGKLSYSRDNINYQENNVITFNDNGTYKIYVQDSLLCSRVTNITINVLKNVNITKRDVTCFGKNDGFIKLQPSNGSQPFKYSLNDGPSGSIREWSNLAGGDYAYLIVDSKNDSLAGIITISQPDSLIIEFVIQGKTLEIKVNGGTPPYVHSIDNGLVFFDTNQFTDLEDPKYDIAVRDKNGCKAFGTALLTGVDDEKTHEDIIIFPNPANDIIFIRNTGKNIGTIFIELKDMSGRTLSVTKESKNDIEEIDLSALPSGSYIIKVKTSQKTITKLIVKH